MAIKKGQYFSLSYSGVDLGKLTDISISIDGKQINISNFDSGEFEEYLLGRKNVTIDFTTFYDQADTTGTGNVVDDLLAGTSDTWVFGPSTPIAGDITYTGSGSPSNITIKASDESGAELSGSIQISGTLTKATTT